MFALSVCRAVQTDLDGWVVQQLSATHCVELLFFDLKSRLANPANPLWPETIYTVAVLTLDCLPARHWTTAGHSKASTPHLLFMYSQRLLCSHTCEHRYHPDTVPALKYQLKGEYTKAVALFFTLVLLCSYCVLHYRKKKPCLLRMSEISWNIAEMLKTKHVDNWRCIYVQFSC